MDDFIRGFSQSSKTSHGLNTLKKDLVEKFTVGQFFSESHLGDGVNIYVIKKSNFSDPYLDIDMEGLSKVKGFEDLHFILKDVGLEISQEYLLEIFKRLNIQDMTDSSPITYNVMK